MKAPIASFFERPRISLSFWLALSAGFIAFSIVSERILFASAIALGSIFLRCLSANISKKVLLPAHFLFTFTAYAAALLPLWPDELSAHYYAPLALILGVAILAAANRNSHGGSRGIASIAAVTFLLLVRNLVTRFEFEFPTQDLALALAFISFTEIALSNRYHKTEDSPHPELVFGLLLSLVASFHFTSIVLGVGLATLTLTAFLLRKHDLSKQVDEHTRSAQLLTPLPRNRAFALSYITLALPFVLAALFYLLTLRIPFWADFLPRKAPSFAYSLAQAAHTLAQNADLEDESIKDFSATLLDQDYIAGKIVQIAQTLSPEQNKESPSPRDQPRPLPELTHQNRAEPTATNEARRQIPPREPQPKTPSLIPTPVSPTRADSPAQEEPYPNETPVLASGDNQDPTTTASSISAPEAESRNFEVAATPPESRPQPAPAVVEPAKPIPTPEKQAKTLADSSSFHQFLNAFDRPEQAISRALNLEGSDVSALLSEEPLVTVTLDSTKNLPNRLYLRRNVLDTVTNDGLAGIRRAQHRVEVSTANNASVPLAGFRQSKSDGATLTITSNQSRHPSLPLPDSFASIQIFNTPSIDIYPEDRVAIAPASSGPITYRVFEADLEITAKERLSAAPGPDYRSRMLEVPLSQEDRAYLQELAERIGGSRSTTRQFAYRLSSYFENRHPYSFFVNIPTGREHAVVRWLKSESAGLCSNYAAAFTLLARSRGIPTRVVSGYATREFDRADARYVIRQNNAHAWVEFLDESNHWVRFDPTPAIEANEASRAEPYVTAASPQSLERLVSSQTQATQPLEEAPTPVAATQIPSPTETIARIETTLPAFTPDPAVEPSEIRAPPSPLPVENTPPALAPSNKTPAPPSPSPEGAPATTTPAAVNATPPPPQPSSLEPPSDKSPPWLFILCLLALVVPGAALIMRINKTERPSPQLQLRHQAGRLLRQLDSLVQEHQLAHDPMWIDMRDTLSAQRYGREANPILVQEIAVKVGLLSKRKK